jgi:hypothetical protein
MITGFLMKVSGDLGMRLTEKQVIQLEEEEKLAQLLDKGDLTLGEYEKKLDEIEERFGDKK